MKAAQILSIISIAIFIQLANAQNPEPPKWDRSKQSYDEYVKAVGDYNDQVSKKNAEVLCKNAPKALVVGMSATQLNCILGGEPENKTTTTTASGESVLHDYGSIWVYSQNGIVTSWTKRE